jgi:hypothetical protein
MLTRTLMNSTVVLLLGLAGCASTPSAKSQDMSKAQHEQVAAQHEQAAARLASSYEPKASKEEVETSARPYGGSWTSATKATSEQKTDAAKHRKIAAEHRAAAQTLREAEARSCEGISDTDRDQSPFEHREDITGVTPYSEVRSPGDVGYMPQEMTLKGAVITFRAVQGMTAEWLQRVVDCHLARNASMGFGMPEMSFCPLAVKGARAKVTSTGNGFSVTVESNDRATAEEILRRAQALVT